MLKRHKKFWKKVFERWKVWKVHFGYDVDSDSIFVGAGLLRLSFYLSSFFFALSP